MYLDKAICELLLMKKLTKWNSYLDFYQLMILMTAEKYGRPKSRVHK